MSHKQAVLSLSNLALAAVVALEVLGVQSLSRANGPQAVAADDALYSETAQAPAAEVQLVAQATIASR